MLNMILPLAIALAAGGNFDQSHAALDSILKARVSQGLVDYKGLQADRAPLDAYLAQAGAVPMAEFQQWTREEQLALLINVYNAATLQLIIDGYPVDSIKSLGGLVKSPWSREIVQLFGKKISLDTLEHKIIRKNYQEPRIHFAVVCAAMGCPPLRAEAYTGARLEEQLDAQTREFLTTPAKNRVDAEKKTLWLSPIFKWYGDDFETTSKSLAAFVAPYIGAAEGANLDDFAIEYTDYDWSLNEQGKAR
ncbi:MAG: DUF547 domain-containing protein [Candidatus Hydrogenedentes bacterium]|nr:DUF547 domain-containing protein [Candidatus Hydrogenedentota bacterium]